MTDFPPFVNYRCHLSAGFGREGQGLYRLINLDWDKSARTPLIQTVTGRGLAAFTETSSSTLKKGGRVAAAWCRDENVPVEGEEQHVDAVKAELGIWTTALMDQGAACLVSLPGEVCKDDFELKAGSKDRQSLLGTSQQG